MKAALSIAAGVLVVAIGIPLLASMTSGNESGGTEARHKVPDYAERMGLNLVPRERYEGCPFKLSYAETEECLGAPGVPITRVENLPPFPIKVTLRMWRRHVEEPGIDVYAWVNEYDEAMITTFMNDEAVSQYAGQPPEL